MNRTYAFVFGLVIGLALGLGIAVFLALDVLQMDMIYPAAGIVWA